LPYEHEILKTQEAIMNSVKSGSEWLKSVKEKATTVTAEEAK